ncbi:hypothetical protein ACFZCV_20520 [Streptomyces sp. NPDC007920]|uniref:hypothetical protein n=1 Tax=Streptomyces sp. NPDC007920 TaxID=3364794 RepID=UPI0036E6B383
MTSHKSNEGPRRPIESAPGVLVHPAADRLLAAEHWLLSTHPRPKQARAEWADRGAALLPLGTLFSAARIPGALVQAVAATTEAGEIDAFLEDALSGPVICNRRHHCYYALLPASTPATWRDAADDWRTQDVDVLGRGCYLGVPPLTTAKASRHKGDSYWSVPMPSPAILCQPLTVARLIAAGAHQLAEAAESDKPRAVEP